MAKQKNQTKILFFTMLLLALGGAYYWFNMRETPSAAAEKLAAQNIEVNPDNFFAEVKAGHIENIGLFLKAGAELGLQDAKGNTPLMVAVDNGNKETTAYLLQLISTMPDGSKLINFQNTTNQKTALLIAAEKGDVAIAELLMNYGADTFITGRTGETPLSVAARKGNTALVTMIINVEANRHVASINVADTGGDTPLTYAIRQNNQSLVDHLLAIKANAVDANGSGTTPLMIAAEVGNVDIGTKLLNAGAKVDTADRMGNTPLTLAISHSQPAFARLLLAKGASADFHTTGTTPLQATISTEPLDAPLFSYLLAQSKDKATITPAVMFSAIDHKNGALVQVLLEHGISANATDEKGETLLYRAIENGLEDAALLLIEKGANINQTGIPGITPLERATKRNEVKVVEKLIALGVSPDQKTAEGYTLAEMAVYSGYPEILDTLLAKGAKLEKDFGVLWAIRDGGGRSVPVLLKHGAKSNVMSNSGDPAIWLAASLGEVDAVKALIAEHSGIESSNTAQSMTPLAIASHSGHLPVVKLLVESGAKIEAPDAFGMTPLAHAAYMTKPDVVEYLLSKGANINASDKQGRSINDLAALATPSAGRDQVMTLLQKR